MEHVKHEKKNKFSHIFYFMEYNGLGEKLGKNLTFKFDSKSF